MVSGRRSSLLIPATGPGEHHALGCVSHTARPRTSLSYRPTTPGAGGAQPVTAPRKALSAAQFIPCTSCMRNHSGPVSTPSKATT